MVHLSAIVHLMLDDFSEIIWLTIHKVFERVSNQFAELPLHFMRFFGSTTVDKVGCTIKLTVLNC